MTVTSAAVASTLARARVAHTRAAAAQRRARHWTDTVANQCLRAQVLLIRTAFARRPTLWATRRGAAVAEARLPPVQDSYAAATALFDELCRGRRLDPAGRFAARLVLAELVANAIRHAGTPFDVWLRVTGPYLAVAVGDDSPAPPAAGVPATVVPAAERPDGRGVWLVARSAAEWGHFPTATGKVVWAVLHLPRAMR